MALQIFLRLAAKKQKQKYLDRISLWQKPTRVSHLHVWAYPELLVKKLPPSLCCSFLPHHTHLSVAHIDPQAFVW